VSGEVLASDIITVLIRLQGYDARTLEGMYQCCEGKLWASILKMEVEIFSETEVPYHQTTRALHN
jgi:hypothetical protein